MATKYCFVLSCTNNSQKDPQKLFVYVPKNASKRQAWCNAVGRRIGSIGISSSCYCCDDHFNVDEDFEDVDDTLSCRKRKLKPGVLPCIKHLDNLSDSIVSFTSVVSKSTDSASKDASMISETSHSHDTTNGNDSISKTSHSHDTTNGDDSMISHTSNFPASDGKEELDALSSTFSSCDINEEDDPEWIPSDDSFSSSENEKPADAEDGVSKEIRELAKLKQEVLLKTELVKNYFGIEFVKMYLVDVICSEAGLRKSHVLMSLQKIKQNLSFAVLAFDYAISPSHCGRVFSQTISVLAKALEKFVMWSNNEVVEHRLPLAFRANFNDVTSIIDCFEIQIQKPSNAVHQSHTWSQYKQCNTIKYLVSSTPDGVVNFISEGFGGRISDLEIVKCSGYLDTLPPNSVVMADRGFKSIESLLATKNCRLVRPPSVSANEKMTSADVHLTKQVAALRIHIERVIKRYREFAILLPHATVNNYLIASVDEIVRVVSALINIQSALIK